MITKNSTPIENAIYKRHIYLVKQKLLKLSLYYVLDVQNKIIYVT